jgi:HEAT repeat protein
MHYRPRLPHHTMRINKHTAAHVARLRLDDEREAQAAMDVLAAMGPAAVPALVAALRHHHIQYRARAATVLGMIHDVRAVAPLIVAVNDEMVIVRMAAIEALGVVLHATYTTAPSDAFDTGVVALIAAYEGHHPSQRWCVVQALGALWAAPTGEAATLVTDNTAASNGALAQIRVLLERAQGDADEQVARLAARLLRDGEY